MQNNSKQEDKTEDEPEEDHLNINMTSHCSGASKICAVTNIMV